MEISLILIESFISHMLENVAFMMRFCVDYTFHYSETVRNILCVCCTLVGPLEHAGYGKISTAPV